MVEIEVWRRCCKVKRTERITNEEIQNRMAVDNDEVGIIEEKQLKWYGQMKI